MSGMGGEGGGGGVVRCGYLKKLKTFRKKFFVLRAETVDGSARLEYYDSERKYNNGHPPKRSIVLKSCFNINRRVDTKHKHVIALYTKDDVFCVVLESEEDVDSWLKALLWLQHGEDVVDGESPKPTFEHVWPVQILQRGLGTAGIVGNYVLCLTDKSLSLIRRDGELFQIEVSLTNVRSCGNLRDFFFLEIGRSSVLGAGELWMKTEDLNISSNIHNRLFSPNDPPQPPSGTGATPRGPTSGGTTNKDDMGPRSRSRSSSGSEWRAGVMARKVHATISRCHLFSQDASHSTAGSSVRFLRPIVSGVASFYHHLIQRGSSKASERRHSISAGGVNPTGTIGHQRTQSLPLANPAPNQNTSHPLRTAKRSKSSRCSSGGRDRCDSMPSRARTTSEGAHPPTQFWSRSHHLNPFRPSSLYKRESSHSPPSESPVSPPSAGCSSDSAGSSHSLAEDTDAVDAAQATTGRYPHSITPTETIAEEECPESPAYTPVAPPPMMPAPQSTDDGYVDMSPRGRPQNQSPTVSTSSVTSGTPSTDMRFAEYPFEKVSSYFAPSETEEDDARPARAYSVGSKPDNQKKSTDMFAANQENLRVRALSVGSKTKKAPVRVLPPHGYHPHQGPKASSAPLLSHSRGQGSHSSIGPMGDLMELDFSRPGSVTSSGYMDMRPGVKTNNDGYVEMKPGRNPNMSPYVDMSGSSPAKASHIPPEDYMPMDLRKPNNNNYQNNNNNNNSGDYLAMSFKRPPASYQQSPAKVSTKMLAKTEPATPEGYVEMSLGRGHQRQSSLDSDDYANMSVGKKRNRKKDKSRSQPIVIQQNSSAATSKGAASSPRYALLARKSSTGTPPTAMHLPLVEASAYSSLPRRKRDPKDAASITPTGSPTIFPFSPLSPSKNADTSDYTPMDFENKNSDYVNYEPGEDYAMMRPGVRVTTPTVQLAGLRLAESTSFRPIDERPEERGEGAYEVLRARPGSTTSDVASTSSTVVGSRPSSVTSADAQLHYASLDLEEGNRSPRADNPTQAELTLTYAAIDFAKSEGLKQNTAGTNAKVKH